MNSLKTVCVSTLSLALLIAGCGKSNATKDFSNLKLGPVHNGTVAAQAASSPLLRISFPTGDGSESSIANFNEGDEGVVKIKVEKLDKLTDVTLVMNSVLPGYKLNPDGDGVWSLIWTPVKGTIPPERRNLIIPLDFVAYAITDDDAKMPISSLHRTLDLVVDKGGSAPKILSVSIPEKVDQDETAIITVIAKDPTHGGAEKPTVKADDYNEKLSPNGEDPRFNGRKFLSQETEGVANGNGSFAYKFAFNTQGSEIYHNPDKSQPGVLYCFNLSVISSALIPSSPSTYCTRILYKTQPAYAIFKTDPNGQNLPIEIAVGVKNTIEFTASTASGFGNLSVKSTDKYAKFPSEKGLGPVLECKPTGVNGDASVQSCTVTWTPSCKAGKKPAQLNFELINTYVGKPIHQPAQRKLVYSQTEVNCPTAAAAVEKAAPVVAKTAPVVEKSASVPAADATTKSIAVKKVVKKSAHTHSTAKAKSKTNVKSKSKVSEVDGDFATTPGEKK
jgi:hypothetical protein